MGLGQCISNTVLLDLYEIDEKQYNMGAVNYHAGETVTPQCTTLTQSHLLQFVYRSFYSIPSLQLNPTARLIDWGLLCWAAEWKRSGINEASDKSATETCVSVFNSTCDEVLQLVEPMGFHYTKTNGWTRHSWIWDWGGQVWGVGGR